MKAPDATMPMFVADGMHVTMPDDPLPLRPLPTHIQQLSVMSQLM